jgi:hypothetical protein
LASQVEVPVIAATERYASLVRRIAAYFLDVTLEVTIILSVGLCFRFFRIAGRTPPSQRVGCDEAIFQ